MALTIADLLGPLLQRPMMGGPAFGSLLPKSPTNVTGGSPPAPTPPPQSSDAQFLQAMTQMGLAGPQNELHRAQAEQAKALAKFLGTDEPPPAGFGQRGQAGSAPGSMSGPVSMPTGMPSLDTIVPAATQAPDMGGGMRAGGALTSDPLALIEKYESGGRNIMQGVVPPEGGYNPSVGRVTGPSTAQGYYQITNTTWRETAPKAGVDLSVFPNAMSAPKEVQAKVAQTLFDEQGFKPWAPYNAKLAAAIKQGEGGGPPARMAHAAPQQAPAFGTISPPGYRSPFSPEDIAWAQRQDQRNAKIGKRNPAMVDEALKMAPGMSGSPEYKARLHSDQKNIDLRFAAPLKEAEVGVTEPSTMRVDANKSGLDRESERLKQERDAALARETKAQEQRGAAALDMTTIIVNGRRMPVTREQAVAAASGKPVPELGIGPLSGAQLGEPVNIGPIPPGQQLTETPGGGGRLEPIPGGPAAQSEQEKEQAKRQSADIVSQDIGRALQLSGSLTTGLAGSASKNFPGTPAYDLQATLQTIKANVGFDRLQQMRNSSPTGGALGQVSEQENRLLQSTMGNIEQSQSREQFEKNLRRLHAVYQDIIAGSPQQLGTLLKEGKITKEQHDAAMARRSATSLSDAPPNNPNAAKSGITPTGLMWRVE